MPPSQSGQTCLVALLATFALAACEGTTLGRFDVEEPLPPTRIEGAGLTGLLPSTFTPFALDIKSTEAFQQEDADFVTGIRLRSLVLAITEGSEDASQDSLQDGMPDDFAFLHSIDLHIEATFDGQTQRERLGGLAENDARFAQGVQELSLDMTGIDILDYVEADGGYTVQVSASGNPPPDDVEFAGQAVYQVSVGFK